MDDSLPSEFDLIVVGTGFTESIVAAAASRVGKTVLHVDVNDFYGGHWASFNLESLQTLATNSLRNDEAEKNCVQVDDESQLRTTPFRLNNVQHDWTPIPEPDESVATEAAETSSDAADVADDNVAAVAAEPMPRPAPIAEPATPQETALKMSRRFNIDLTPKLLYARGQLVELLISSNICRYSEFRAVDRVVTVLESPATGDGGGGGGGGVLKAVPCSRSDIFTSKEVSVVEKRLLSKHLLVFLNLSADDPLHATYAGRTFREYLLDNRLSAKLVHYVLHAIAMCGEQAAFADGAERTKRFLLSAERYGSTPFLFAMYGCGELPQCFCRLCAVFGGVYCLKRPIDAVHRNADGRFEAITCGQQRITAANIVFGPGSTLSSSVDQHEKDTTTSCGNMSRGILLTNRPFGDEALNSGGGGVILLKLPAIAGAESSADDGAQVLQLSHYSGTCPKGWYLVHLTCTASGGNNPDPEQDLAPYVAQLSLDAGTDIVWSMYFTIPACGQCERTRNADANGVHFVCGPHFELDYDRSIAEARALFAQLYTDAEEFLPRAPDPEEIIVAGSEEDDEANAGRAPVDASTEACTEDVDKEEVAEEACA